MLKKSAFCAIMLGLVVIAVASSGGGKSKSSRCALGIIPLRGNGTLADESKAGYTGSHFLTVINRKNTTVYKSVITYQKGNTTYIVPSQFRMSNEPKGNSSPKLSFRSGSFSRSNLNLVDLKIRLSR